MATQPEVKPGVLERPGGNSALLVVALCTGLLLRTFTFQTRAIGLDSAEYCWTSWSGLIPHSPYLLYTAMGYALSALIPPEWGLSLLSFLANLLATFFFSLILRGQRFEPASRNVAISLYLLSPVALYQAGLQEVYAFQSCLVLGSAWLLQAGGRWRVFGSVLFFGAAWLAHNGTIFTLPVFVILCFSSGPTTDVRRRLVQTGVWATLAMTLVGLGYGALLARYTVLFPGTAWKMTRAALRGISPFPHVPRTPLALWDSFQRLADHLSRPTAFDWPIWVLLVVCGAAVCLSRQRMRLLAWALLPGLYLSYEIVLGYTPDTGVYLVYVLPFVAIATGEVHQEVLRKVAHLPTKTHWLDVLDPGRLLSTLVCVLTLLLLFVPAASLTLRSDPPFQTRSPREPVRDLLLQVRASTPVDSWIVVEGPPLESFEAGCWSGRRIITRHPLGLGPRQDDPSVPYLRLREPKPGSGSTRSFYDIFSEEELLQLLEGGQMVLSLTSPPFQEPLEGGPSSLEGAYETVPCPDAVFSSLEGPVLYRLVLPGHSEQGTCTMSTDADSGS